jgi:hypothetical protein
MMAKEKEIGSLLGLLGISMLVACALVGYMVYNWGPSGVYKLKNVILSPGNLEELTYRDVSPSGATGTQMVFDRLEFIQLTPLGGGRQRASVSPQAYSRFYDLVRQEKSLDPVPSQLVESFFHQSAMHFLVRPERSGDSGGQRVFQEVQFSADGDHYRVELRFDSKGRPWAYFYHPNIEKEVAAIFSGGA